MKFPRLLFLLALCHVVSASLESGECVTVTRGGLFHSGMLAATRSDDAVDRLITDIWYVTKVHKAKLTDVVKLNIYSTRSDAGHLDSIRKEFMKAWPEGAERPAVTIIPTRLPADWVLAVDVVVRLAEVEESVFPQIGKTGAVLPPGCDAVYISGRAASGELVEATAGTMKQLFDVLGHLESGKENVVQVKAFIKPMTGWETVKTEIEKSFGTHPVPPIIFVEWTSTSRTTEIELVATAPPTENADGPISYFTPPGDKSSPVYSRVARISGDKIVYIGGVTGPDNKTAEQEIRSLFGELKRIAEGAGSDLRHFAKATYYVSENGVSKALNELRPEYYDPMRPPAASKVQVPGIGVPGRGMLIDMVAVPLQ